MSPIKEVEISQ